MAFSRPSVELMGLVGLVVLSGLVGLVGVVELEESSSLLRSMGQSGPLRNSEREVVGISSITPSTRMVLGDPGIFSTSVDMSSDDASDPFGLKADDAPGEEEEGLEEVPMGDGVEGRFGL